MLDQSSFVHLASDVKLELRELVREKLHSAGAQFSDSQLNTLCNDLLAYITTGAVPVNISPTVRAQPLQRQEIVLNYETSRQLLGSNPYNAPGLEMNSFAASGQQVVDESKLWEWS